MPLPHGNQATLRRLEAVRAAFAQTPAAPIFPVPVAHLRQLGVLVVEAPRGPRLSALLTTPQAFVHLERLAQALLAIHQAQVSLEQHRPWHREMTLLQKRVQKLESTAPALHDSAAQLLARIGRTEELRVTAAPAFHTLRPGDVLCLDQQIAFTRVDSLVLAPPYITAADLLARLALGALRGDHDADGTKLRQQIRAAYRAELGFPEDHAAPVEAAALLRLACTQVDKGAEPALPARLIAQASTLV